MSVQPTPKKSFSAMGLTSPVRRIMAMTAAMAIIATATSPAMAQENASSNTSVFQMFFWSSDILGLLIIYILLFMSVAVFALSAQYLLKYRRVAMIPEQTQTEIESMLAEKQYREAIDYANEDTSYLGKLLSSAMNEAANGHGAMERAIEETGDAETSRYLRPIELLNVLGNIAPMLGLFGTVYGMIVAFQQLVAAGGKPDPASLAAGISTALVTTFWGLIVAMPALAAYALIRNKIDALTSEGLLVAEELISPFKPSGKKSSSSSSSSSRPRATPNPDVES